MREKQSKESAAYSKRREEADVGKDGMDDDEEEDEEEDVKHAAVPKPSGRHKEEADDEEGVADYEKAPRRAADKVIQWAVDGGSSRTFKEGKELRCR